MGDFAFGRAEDRAQFESWFHSFPGRKHLIIGNHDDEAVISLPWERTPFHISRNELEVAAERRDDWYLFRLYEFARAPQAFELRPPLDAHVTLTATNFEASFQ